MEQAYTQMASILRNYDQYDAARTNLNVAYQLSPSADKQHE